MIEIWVSLRGFGVLFIQQIAYQIYDYKMCRIIIGLEILMNGGMQICVIVFIFCVTFNTYYETMISVLNHAEKTKGKIATQNRFKSQYI